MSEADITTEATAGAAPDHMGEAKPFQADVSRLLDLMVHSIYSERDVFLRELISNAADACEKLRYEAIAEPQLTSDGEGFVIRVLLDKDAKTLSIVDNGIGMSRDDLDKALGTIASSGTKAFLDKIGNDAEAESGNLIGQFGIGFYSGLHGGGSGRGEDASRRQQRSLALDQRRQGRLCDRAAASRGGSGARHPRHAPLERDGGRRVSRTLERRAARQGAFGRRRGCRSNSSTSPTPRRGASPTARPSGPRPRATSSRKTIPNSTGRWRASTMSRP